MALTPEDAAELARLTALAAEPETPEPVSDAAVIAQAEASVAVAQINADAAVELAHINEDASVARAEAYAAEEAARVEGNAAAAAQDAQETADLALAVAVEAAVIATEGDAPAADPTGTPGSVEDASADGLAAPPAATAEGDETPGTKHEQPKTGEGEGKKPHWYERKIG